MGKHGGNRFRGGRSGGQRSVRADYEEVVKHNELYEKFYNALEIVGEDERDEFWTALRRELPNSFRFTGSKGHALPVLQRLREFYIPQITAIKYEGMPVDPPTPIPWYPDQLAWQMTTPKNVVRRFAPFSSFQKFLVSETSVGNISRQEVVSMIPPLVMDVRPGMTVLDLCAAPGSKSAQLIELIHSGEEGRVRNVVRMVQMAEGRKALPETVEIRKEDEAEEAEIDMSDDGRSTGLLIANDIEYKRAHMLIHQMKRLNSPNLIVTNHDATMYPSIKLPSEPQLNGRPEKARYLKFDRILADVPCSGDGTCRKNPGVWKEWNPANALGLHATQVRILIRALQMLKVGGRVVYSTCSMNPIENEAVIASAINRCGGLEKVGVVDCSHVLPQLRRRPGLTSWKVMDRRGRMWESWDEVRDFQAKEGVEGMGKLSDGMFSPMKGTDEIPNIPLERCMRVYGHQQDTGAFFITVLEKKTEIKARADGQPKNSNAEINKAKFNKTAAADEIAPMQLNGENAFHHTKALDKIAPPQTDDGETRSASAAARPNMENAPHVAVSSFKRALDDTTDVAMSTKRPKIREEIDAPAPRGEEERRVHCLSPPAAMLDVTQGAPPQEVRQHSESTSLPNTIRKKDKPQFEEPYKYLDIANTELQVIYGFYQLHERFPKDRFMVRNADGIPSKTIYYTSTLARDILVENEGKGLKFVHCGIKMFVKQDVQKEGTCKWRIQTEGLPILESWVGEHRTVKLWSRHVLRNLLVEMFPKVTDDGWKALGEIGERVRDIQMGCCLLRVEATEGEDGFSESMVLPLWRSLHSLNLMLPKEERKALLLRLYNDDSPLVDHSKDRFLDRANGERGGTHSNIDGEFQSRQNIKGEGLCNEGTGADVTDVLGKVDAVLETNDREETVLGDIAI